MDTTNGEAMKLKQESRALKQKALDSLIFTIEAFNSPHEAGRATRVLLHLQHAFEMLLKAALVQTKDKRVFDSETGRSIGFERCVRLAAENNIIKLGESDAGTLRAIDAMRDDEQHWFNIVSEQLLYLHARAGVTLFDELLQRVFSEHLADRLPGRVLPISVDPPRELAMVLDDEYSQITALLQPHRRAGHEARARLRTLLAMEAHLEPDTRVSDKDVTRVERGIRDGKSRDEVFPRLEDVATAIDGDGVQVVVHFTKKQGAPVRFESDESLPAAGIREVDLLKKFHRPPAVLADDLGITASRSTALRRHLGMETDGPFSREFVLSPSNRQRRYSDNAFRLMSEALDTVDMDEIWAAHSPNRGSSSWSRCEIAGCAAEQSLRSA